MKYGVYSIFDSAAGVFTAPTIDISDGSALRNFQQAIANSGSVMNFKPDDFVLYQIGTFDVETGKLDPWIPPSRLIAGSDGDYRKEIVDE
nr:phage ORF5 protein [uncultured Oscillibacter sp.]